MLRIFSLSFFLVVFGSVYQTQAFAQQPAFSHQGVEMDGKRYEGWLRKNWQSHDRNSNSQRADGFKVLSEGNDPRAASRLFAQAVVNNPNDAIAWIGLAQALLAIPRKDMQGSEHYNIPANASGAAYLGYLRARNERGRGEALAVLAEALARRSYWRPALDAYKASLKLHDNATVRQAYDALQATRGFRILDYTVENETATPRVCIEFSELLQRGKIDFTRFISVNGQDPQSATPEGSQLCIDGLKHGERYEIGVRAGLPADADDHLAKKSELAVYVRDRAPTVRFTGKSYVLPSRGQAGVPVVSINASQLQVEIYRIGDRSLVGAVANGTLHKQLSNWELSDVAQQSGQRVYQGSLAVRPELNKEVTIAIPVSEAVPDLKPGVYAAIARPNGNTDSFATQWFIVSDLGLTTLSATNGIHTFVRSLATTEPLGGVEVKLVARNNEILGTATTDDRGYVHFDAALGKGEGGLATAMIMAQARHGDYAFLDIAAAAFDLTDRGVKGRDAPGPVDAYIYTERGVYRPGEEANLTALVRDAKGVGLTLPVTMVIERPDGVEFSRFVLQDQGGGGRTASLIVPGSAMTGTWRVHLYADPKARALASQSFLVEEFVPERLALQLKAAQKQLLPGETGTVKVAGRFLYGAPAANLGLEGEVIVKASKEDVPGYEGYNFGLASERIDQEQQALEKPGRTDANGHAALSVALPQIPQTAKPLEARVVVRMLEPGGRSIERTLRIPVAARVDRIGIKPLFEGAALQEDTTAAFDVISLDSEGQRSELENIEWELVRLEQRWQWYKRDGTWAYDAVTIPRKVADGKLATSRDVAGQISAAVKWGRYRLDVRSSDVNGPASSYQFTAGWYASEDADSPEVLPVALDKESYLAGDTAKLKISSRFGGRAMISVVGNGLISTRDVMIKAGDDEIEISVGQDWGAGVYIVATLYRAMDIEAKRMPERTLGVAWLGIDQSRRTLSVNMELPDKVGSGTALKVPVRLDGLKQGETAYVTVAAVDVGVLNLTRFKTPAPETWFYAQRLLGVEYRDFYGRLIDGMRAERGTLRSGGDGASAGLEGNPPVEETLSLFSGIVKAAADGTAEVKFDLPDFNGTVRVMAVAWSTAQLGHAVKDIIVRDPVALTVSGPRFITLGDQARLQLALHNIEGPDDTYKVRVMRTYEGEHVKENITQRALSQTAVTGEVFKAEVDLKADARHALAFTLAPQHLGRVAYEVRVTGPGGIDISRDLLFDVKAPARDVRRVTVTALRANGGSLNISQDLLSDMVPGQAQISLSVGPLARFNVPALLTQLESYPYGCAEQTTSRALPLLYASTLAEQGGSEGDAKVRERIQEAIAHLYSMQDSTGGFGVWQPGNADIWLTAYVTDFLSRARKARFDVDEAKFRNALDRLQNYVSYVSDFKIGGENRAYALYVLALNGRAPIGELRYYADARLERFGTPLAKAQIGAALAMMGDKARAERAFAAALADLKDLSVTGLRNDYGSALRDGAAVLTLASEVRIMPAAGARLAEVLAHAFTARTHTSTQEQAWMLLAANAVLDDAQAVSLDINGERRAGHLNRTLTAAALQEGPLKIANVGQAATDAVISVMGTALTPEPSAAQGFTISRTYYTLDGQPTKIGTSDGKSEAVKQGERFVAVLKIKSDDPGGRVLLVDRLPAGFEIENPRLIYSADIKVLPWLKTQVHPNHTEFRDDRFVAAFDFLETGDKHREATVAYIVRAVTPGTFVHPAALVEDMYRPHLFARTAAAALRITSRE